MPKKMTESEFALCKQIASETRDERYQKLGNTAEMGYVQVYLGASAEEREVLLGVMLLCSKYNYLYWRALQLLGQELRDKQETIPAILSYWFIDRDLGRIEAPKLHAGQKYHNRDLAIALSMYRLSKLDMKMMRRKESTDDKEKRKKENRPPPVSAADAVASVFCTSFETVMSTWNDTARPDYRYSRSYLAILDRNLFPPAID